MLHVRYVVSTLMALVGRGSLVLVGAVVFFALVPRWGADPDNRASTAAMDRAVRRGDSKTDRVTLTVPRGDNSVPLVIQSADRSVMGTCILHRDGAFTFEMNGSGPVRFVADRNPSGSIFVGVRNALVRFTVRAGRDGSADLFVSDAAEKPVSGIRVTSEGRFLPSDDAPMP